MISIEHALSHLEPWLASYGAFALFVAIYLESFGLPLPGESALVAASVLAIRGDLSIITLFAAAWSGAVLGDTTGYLSGGSAGRRYSCVSGHISASRRSALSAWRRKSAVTASCWSCWRASSFYRGSSTGSSPARGRCH